MSDEDRRCGTCRWWELRDIEAMLGWCNCPIPDSVDGDTEICMHEKKGTKCPCWARKESDGA